MKERYQNTLGMPWLDVRIEDEYMKHLWDSINIPSQQPSTQCSGENISKSVHFKDKDNIFYENVLKELSEYMFFQNWANYFYSHIANSKPPPVFKLNEIWVNYHKQHEFNPPHTHVNNTFAFVVFMKIPTYWEEQHKLSQRQSLGGRIPVASDFQFLLGQAQGEIEPISIPLSPNDEGRMLFFPAWLSHQVFPFYGTEEERVTIAGNIELFQDQPPQSAKTLDNMEKMLEEMERQVDALKESIQNKKTKNTALNDYK